MLDWSRPMKTRAGYTALLVERLSGPFPMSVLIVYGEESSVQPYTPEGEHRGGMQAMRLTNVSTEEFVGTKRRVA